MVLDGALARRRFHETPRRRPHRSGRRNAPARRRPPGNTVACRRCAAPAGRKASVAASRAPPAPAASAAFRHRRTHRSRGRRQVAGASSRAGHGCRRWRARGRQRGAARFGKQGGGIRDALGGQPRGRGIRCRRGHRPLATPADNRRQQAVDARRHQQEHDARRRFFERLQQGVRRRGIQRLGGIQHDHPCAAAMRTDATKIEQRPDLFNLDFLARRAGFLAVVGVGLVRGFAGRRKTPLRPPGLPARSPGNPVIALHQPVARDAVAAGLAVRQRRLAQQPLRHMLGKAQLANAGLAVDQQRVRPCARSC